MDIPVFLQHASSMIGENTVALRKCWLVSPNMQDPMSHLGIGMTRLVGSTAPGDIGQQLWASPLEIWVMKFPTVRACLLKALQQQIEFKHRRGKHQPHVQRGAAS